MTWSVLTISNLTLIIWILGWLLKLDIRVKIFERSKESSAQSNIIEDSRNIWIFVWFCVVVTNTLVCKVNFTVVSDNLYFVSFRKFFFNKCFLKFIISFPDFPLLNVIEPFIFFFTWFISFNFKPRSFNCLFSKSFINV